MRGRQEGIKANLLAKGDCQDPWPKYKEDSSRKSTGYKIQSEET